MEAHRCLMARWSCSTTLLRYRRARTSTCRQRGSSLPSNSKPRRVALLRSMLIFLGHGTRPSATAARKNDCADSLLRSLQSRDPMDCRSYPRLEIGNADRHGQTQLFRPYATTHQEVWKSEPIDTRTLA